MTPYETQLNIAASLKAIACCSELLTGLVFLLLFYLIYKRDKRQ